MIKLIKEDIEGIRYCVISRTGNRKFYDFEEFCDSRSDAINKMTQYSKSNDDVEYIAFDTKKWKTIKHPSNSEFNYHFPIYITTDNGEAELLTNYVDRVVDDKTGRWNESVIREARKPKYWNSKFATKVIDAYKNGELTKDNIEEWEIEYNDGVKPNKSLGTREILTYYISTKNDPRNESYKRLHGDRRNFGQRNIFTDFNER